MRDEPRAEDDEAEKAEPARRRGPADDDEPAPEDAVLVGRCRTGDESACEALVRRYAPRCARLAGHFLARADAVADVVQESLAAALTSLDRYDASRPFWPWLARMVVNASIDRLRAARGRLERTSGSLDARPGATRRPEEAAAEAEERERVHRVLAALPPPYRTVLVLREMEGMSAEEMAAVLRRPAATVRWRLFKARRLFRQAWFGLGQNDSRRDTETQR